MVGRSEQADVKIHEYQAKTLLGEAGIPIPAGGVADSPQAALAIAQRVGLPVAIKAQVQVGGRGKAGGIQLAIAADDVLHHADAILSMHIKDLPVRKVLVERAVAIAGEKYLSIIVDRGARRAVVISSAQGGVDIEEVARTSPTAVHYMHVDPLVGLRPYNARAALAPLFEDSAQLREGSQILEKMYWLFMSKDLSLVEINPLVVTDAGDLVALDAKVTIDDNGLGRHPELEALRDPDAEDPREMEAKRAGLSYVKLNGQIGCVVNGAGLAMATMDLVKRYGAEPANFLDVGGSSSPEKVLNAMRILLSDPNVRVVLFNIFGGITRCDDIARGIVAATQQLGVTAPIVARLTGTNQAEGRAILESVNLRYSTSMDEAVRSAVALVADVPAPQGATR